ncbi:DMT family transporter [Actinomadura sp. 6N118]|uniref:DMT family transporter n=1 Tax=Actinomadura sp. 6N118 TaxID=3375151 RepID=UPI0037B11999
MSDRRIDLLLAAGFVIAWSSGFIGAELGTRTAAASSLLAWRFIIAFAVLALWMLWRRRRVPPRELALHLVIGGLGQVGYLYGVFAAVEHGVSSGTTALICALQPIVAVTLAVPLLGESVSRRQIAGFVIGLAGVALVVSADLGISRAPLPAYLLPVAAMLSLVAATLIERRTRPRATLIDALTIQAGISALLFSALATATGTLTPPADATFWIAIAILVVAAMFGGYGLYWINLARTGVARVSGLLYLTPPATMAWSWLMFGTTMTPLSLAGVGVCALAVLLIRAKPPTRSHPSKSTANVMAGSGP